MQQGNLLAHTTRKVQVKRGSLDPEHKDPHLSVGPGAAPFWGLHGGPPTAAGSQLAEPPPGVSQDSGQGWARPGIYSLLLGGWAMGLILHSSLKLGQSGTGWHLVHVHAPWDQDGTCRQPRKGAISPKPKQSDASRKRVNAVHGQKWIFEKKRIHLSKLTTHC